MDRIIYVMKGDMRTMSTCDKELRVGIKLTMAISTVCVVMIPFMHWTLSLCK